MFRSSDRSRDRRGEVAVVAHHYDPRRASSSQLAIRRSSATSSSATAGSVDALLRERTEHQQGRRWHGPPSGRLSPPGRRPTGTAARSTRSAASAWGRRSRCGSETQTPALRDRGSTRRDRMD